MKRRKYLWISAILLPLLGSCTGNKVQNHSKIVVKSERVASYSGEECKEYTFISRPYRTSVLSFRVGGPIDRFEAYAGNYYSRGSIIAEIDPRDFRFNKERTEAVYARMKAEYERIGKLYEKDNVSASQYEKARADYVTAKAAFNMAASELEDSRLIAPFNGYVDEVYIERFQDVRATQPIVSLMDIDRLRIEVYVTQEVAATARPRDSVEVRFDMYPDRVYRAPVVEVSKGTTRNNLSYLLTALLPNPGHELLAGMSGKVFILPSGESRLSSARSIHAGVVIPRYALCHRPTEGDFVWVVNERTGEVHVRKVTQGRLLPDGKVLIASGLLGDETIATSGLRFLSNGMKVTLSSKKD